MRTLTPDGMKWVKTLHLIFVVMWLGGCLGMGLIALMGYDSAAQLLSQLYMSEAIDYCILIPGAVGTVLTGAVYGIWSKWGFFRHRWLTVKWILSILIILIGTFFFHPYSLGMIAEIEANGEAALGMGVVHLSRDVLRCCGLQAIALALLIPVSVFKPWKQKRS